jgi:hypothetical protein
MRRALFAIITALTVHSAAAEPTQDQCVDAYTTSQQLRADGALRKAHERLLVCASDRCPQVMQPDCVAWLREVEQQIPSVVVRAKLGGSDVADVRVLMDGVEIAPRLDGRAINVDPGQHVFSFEHAGTTPASKTVLINEGERARVIDVELTPLPVRHVPEAQGGQGGEPRRVYVLGAVGIGALAVGGAVGAWGLVKRSGLDDCTPSCSDARRSEVDNRFLGADLAFAIGAVALGAAAYFHWTRPSLGIDAAPTTGGAMVSLHQTF